MAKKKKRRKRRRKRKNFLWEIFAGFVFSFRPQWSHASAKNLRVLQRIVVGEADRLHPFFAEKAADHHRRWEDLRMKTKKQKIWSTSNLIFWQCHFRQVRVNYHEMNYVVCEVGCRDLPLLLAAKERLLWMLQNSLQKESSKEPVCRPKPKYLGENSENCLELPGKSRLTKFPCPRATHDVSLHVRDSR